MTEVSGPGKRITSAPETEYPIADYSFTQLYLA